MEGRLPIHANVQSIDEAVAVGEVPYSGDNALDNGNQLAPLRRPAYHSPIRGKRVQGVGWARMITSGLYMWPLAP